MKERCVLLVDDDSDSTVSLVRALKASGVTEKIHAASSAEKGLEILRSDKPNVAVIDLCLDEKIGVESGFSLLRQIATEDPTCRILVLTGNAGAEHGVRALTLGASNFLQKPANVPHLAALIRDAVVQSDIKRSNQALREESARSADHLIIGIGTTIDKVREQVIYASRTNQPVLITGETGTGKGLCAAAIHKLSERSQGNLVRYQPSFGTADLVSSELFGHIRGAFTGATEDRKGLLVEADSGTLFLDEVDELPNETQVTLLGVLQDKTFRPVGSVKVERSDFRLITASNQKIEACVEDGKIRRDFFHRIAHLRIQLPPLREHKEDIEALSIEALQRLRDREAVSVFEISASALTMLQGYSWPGNVRELQAVVEGGAYHAAFKGRTIIEDEDISIASPNHDTPLRFNDLVRQFKLKLITESLSRNGGNQVQAARELGLDRSTLRRLLSGD